MIGVDEIGIAEAARETGRSARTRCGAERCHAAATDVALSPDQLSRLDGLVLAGTAGDRCSGRARGMLDT